MALLTEQPPGKKYVAIAGNIGAGKSSLTKVLSDYFKWQAFYERVDDNPYLADFYNEMRRWSFNLQVFFLSSRFKHQRQIEEAPHSVVQDRSIYEDAEIFARAAADYVTAAKAEMSDAGTPVPESWAAFIAARCPYQRDEDESHFLDGLRKAGLE